MDGGTEKWLAVRVVTGEEVFLLDKSDQQGKVVFYKKSLKRINNKNWVIAGRKGGRLRREASTWNALTNT